MTAMPGEFGMCPGRSAEQPGASLSGNGEVVACLGTQRNRLEAVT